MVSAIIPNYNHAPYLNKRIDSVLNQTYTDFELIILDDCSTDNSREVIEEYRNNNKVSHIVYNTENSGSTFKQWDKGIQLAKGEYIWIAESDDWCEITFVETIMNGLEKEKNCVVGYCQSYCITDNNNKIKFQSNHIFLEEYVEGKKFIKDFILSRNPIFNAGMAVWKREVYFKISKEYTKYKLSGDYLFWIELCMYGDVFISGRLLNYLRMHGENVGVKSFRSGLNFIEGIPLLKSLLDRNIINKQDYITKLQRDYFAFKFSEKDLPKDNANTIRTLFNSYANSKYELKKYFFKKYIQLNLKRLLKIK